MSNVAIRQEAMRRLVALSDEQIRQTLAYIKSFPQAKRPLQNSKTPEERKRAKKALDELFAMSRPAKSEISIDSREEAAEAAWKKYESLANNARTRFLPRIGTN